MTSSSKLIDLHISGASAKYLVDALLEELPSPDVIRKTILKDLPRSKVKIENDVVWIDCEDRKSVVEKITLFEHMYPELDFVHVNKTIIGDEDG